jgi:hypothetical protein
MLHALVLSAITLKVLDGPKNFGAKESIPFRLEGPIIDGFWFFHLPVAPIHDFFWRSQGDLNLIKFYRRL